MYHSQEDKCHAIPLYKILRVITLIETGSQVVVAMGREIGMLFDGRGSSVWGKE